MKTRRKELCLSAETIAERIHVSPTTIYRYEKGDIEKVPSDVLIEIAAVLIEDEATLKRVYKMPGRLVLRAENPRYAPIDLSGAELDGVRILGKAVYFISSIK